MDNELKTRMSPSLALLTIAEMLRAEHTVILENENIEKIRFDEKTDLVCITVTVDVLPRAAAIAAEYKKRNVPVIAGGIHVSCDPENCAEYFDSVCTGMAEDTLPQMIEDLQNGRLKKIYRSSHSGNTQLVSPGYALADRSKYLYTNIVSTSRGCPYCCDFCYNSCEAYKNLYITRTTSDILNDIKTLKTKHIMFIDDNFIGNSERTRELLRAIKPLRLKWNADVSANIGAMPELLDEMREAGCESLFIGFESLNANALKNVHKGQNKTKKYDALVREIHKRGIMINASFVFGLDGDDETTFGTTLDWIVKNKIETVTSHILTPYPGTRLYEEFASQGRITDFDLSKYNTAHVVYRPLNMTAEQLSAGYLKLYKEIYSFKNIIKRMPVSKRQWLPYLTFNLLYRKFGTFTEWLCALIGFQRIGRFAQWVSYHIK